MVVPTGTPPRPTVRFVDPASIPQHLRCEMCSKPWEAATALACHDCDHLFCRPCIESHLGKSRQCPKCSAEMDLNKMLRPPRELQEHSEQIRVRCPYKADCWEGPWSQLQGHCDECRHRHRPLYVAEPVEAFTCSVCYETLDDPVCVCEEQHLFCRLCVVHVSTCPKCRAVVNCLPPRPSVLRVLGELEVRCPGCAWTGKRREFDAHRATDCPVVGPGAAAAAAGGVVYDGTAVPDVEPVGDPIPVPQPAGSGDGAATTVPAGLKLSVRNYHPTVLAGGCEFVTMATIQAPTAAERPRQPLVLSAALDISGSMSGEKLKRAQEALKFVIQSLQGQDSLGILAFNEAVQEVLPAGPMTDARRRLAVMAVDAMTARGRTNISEALACSVAQVTGSPLRLSAPASVLPTRGGRGGYSLHPRGMSPTAYHFGIRYACSRVKVNGVWLACFGFRLISPPVVGTHRTARVVITSADGTQHALGETTASFPRMEMTHGRSVPFVVELHGARRGAPLMRTGWDVPTNMENGERIFRSEESEGSCLPQVPAFAFRLRYTATRMKVNDRWQLRYTVALDPSVNRPPEADIELRIGEKAGSAMTMPNTQRVVAGSAAVFTLPCGTPDRTFTVAICRPRAPPHEPTYATFNWTPDVEAEVGGHTFTYAGTQPESESVLPGSAVSATTIAPVPQPGGAPRTKAVLLFTDGNATSGITAAAGIEADAQRVLAGHPDVSVYTFGLGRDHNASLLGRIADMSEGSYYYVERSESIATDFADCLGGLLSVYASDVELRLRPAADVVVEEVLTQYTVARDASGAHIVRMKNLFAEEKRDIVVRLKVGQRVSGTEAPVSRFEVSYTDGATARQVKLEGVASAAAAREAYEGQPDLAVDEQLGRLRAVQALEQAQALADDGDCDDAMAVLSRCRKSMAARPAAAAPAMQELLGHLEKAKAATSSWSAGGQQVVSQMRGGHARQRAAHFGAAYDTAAKAALRQQAEAVQPEEQTLL